MQTTISRRKNCHFHFFVIISCINLQSFLDYSKKLNTKDYAWITTYNDYFFIKASSLSESK